MVGLCRDGRRDGIRHPMLDRIADCGSDNYNNCYKEFKDLLRRAGVIDQITDLTGPCFSHCVLPSTVIKLIARNPAEFRLRLAPSKEKIHEFWQHFFSTDDGQHYKALHPHLRNKTVAELSTRFPVVVHEDAGPFTKLKSMDVVSWSSLHGRGTELETKCCVVFVNVGAQETMLKCMRVYINKYYHIA